MVIKSSSREIFYYLLILTGFFLLLEVSFFIQNYRDFLAESSSVSGGLQLPVVFLPQIALFILIQLSIHFVYCVLVWVISLSILRLLSRPIIADLYLSIGIWLCGLFTILLANDIYYPHSKFSELLQFFLFNSFVAKGLLIVFLGVDFFLILLMLLSWVLYTHRLWLVISSIITLILIYNSFYFWEEKQKGIVASNERPHIIVVGVDALRPDFLGFFGREIKTPFMDSFLNHATVFSQAVTPLARTFPSWTSILTGRYPKEVGIRTNLAQLQFADLTYTLPKILKNQGYTTLFATDETRFSNIGTNFGFDRMITPTVGLSDFLFGTINDFPFSNLLVNTALGRWLFPYSYGNRAAYVTYQPDSFLNLLYPVLAESNKTPLFLAVHFCLPHYPYLWADLPEESGQVVWRYQKSIERVDQQLGSFFFMLQQYGLLQRAIVVLLSDHGEALEFTGDRITEKELFLTSNAHRMSIPQFYPKSDNEAVNQSAGHGTDVLGLSQYHSVLAIKLYGMGLQSEKVISHIVSLLDVKPTILDFLGIPSIASSGQSLAGVINGKHEVSLKHLPVFLESDFSPPAIRTVFPNTHQVLLEGINIFSIDPNTLHLIVKEEMNQKIIKSKQYAIIDDEWMLALYPQNADYRMPILINLKTGVWTNDMQSSFARLSPASRLLRSLKKFYGDELDNSPYAAASS